MEELKLKDLEYVDGYKEVIEEYKYKDIIIPEGFMFDGASIPKYLRWRFDPFDPRWIRAACIHDRLYYTHEKPRKICDKILREVMLEDGSPKRTAWEFYYRVRLFGGSHY
jgi:hypothetical protein